MSDDVKHTDGPWDVSGWSITAGSGKLIGEIFQPDGMRQAELDAKAALADAAPDLLEAVRALYAAFPDCHESTIQCRHGHDVMESVGAGRACMMARRAMARATGND